jgi:signal recognition particle subunit SRP54
MKDELINLLGKDYEPLEINFNPTVIMLLGLQGSGKTTTAGKIANYVRKKHNKLPLLIAADVYRPAAIDQLEQIALSLGCDIYSNKEELDVLKIVKEGLDFAKENNNNFIIIDTAGRLQIDETLMTELKNINNNFKIHERLLVIDAMMGQDAINVIKGFNKDLNLTGSVLTKLDGSTKGGVALSLRHLTNVPIKFVGDSEKLDGLSEFHPENMANRILDMGDILAIADKVEGLIDEKEAIEQSKKMKSGKFDLEDFLKTLKQIKKLGSLENILKLIPGARKMGLNNINLDPKDLAHVEAIILSMTLKERKDPSILKASRKIRIANGSGRSVEEVNRLLKQFEEMKKMMKQINSGNMKLPF